MPVSDLAEYSLPIDPQHSLSDNLLDMADVIVKPHRRRRWTYLLAALLIVPAAVIAFFVLSIDDGTDDAYAAWGAGEMVIDYMNTHSGRWPHDWNDLQPQFQVNNGRVGGWTFSQFQSHIYIDFNVNSEDLRAKAIASRYLPFQDRKSVV